MPSVLKRPAAAAPAPAAKKSKPAAAKPKPAPKPKAAPAPPKAKRDPLLVKVTAGLGLARDLPESAKQMLSDMLDFALTSNKEDRHSYQNSVVDLAENTLSSVEKILEDGLAAAQKGVEEAEGKKETCAQTVQECEARLFEQSNDVVKKRKYELADAARAFRAARDAIEEVNMAQDLAERELKKASGDKEQLETALANYFRPLLASGGGGVVSAGASGEGEDVAAAAVEQGEGESQKLGQAEVDILMKILKKYTIDESMMSALPNALMKEPSTRGSFDTMVLSQLDTEVNKRIAAYDIALREAEPAKAERASNLAKADSTFAEAKKAQLDWAESFEEAREEEERRQTALREAKAAVSEAGKEARRHQRESDQFTRQLSNFRNGPQAAFLQLRDRTAPTPEPEQEEEQLEPSAEADVAGDAAADGAGEAVGEAEQNVAMEE